MTTVESWELESKTSFGIQKSILHLTRENNTVTGRMEYKHDGSDIRDIRIEDESLIWKVTRKIITFEFSVKFSGNELTGTVKSRLDKAPVTGTRIDNVDKGIKN